MYVVMGMKTTMIYHYFCLGKDHVLQICSITLRLPMSEVMEMKTTLIFHQLPHLQPFTCGYFGSNKFLEMVPNYHFPFFLM